MRPYLVEWNPMDGKDSYKLLVMPNSPAKRILRNIEVILGDEEQTHFTEDSCRHYLTSYDFFESFIESVTNEGLVIKDVIGQNRMYMLTKPTKEEALMEKKGISATQNQDLLKEIMKNKEKEYFVNFNLN